MTSNPMVRNNVAENVILDSAPMTIQGAVNKTLVLVGIVAAVAYFTWQLCATGLSDRAYLLMIAGAIAGLILAIITSFNPKVSNITAPVYAICEGAVVGAISFAYNAVYSGIVVNALIATFAALFTMLLLYKARILQATPTFRRVIITSTIAIAIFYLVGFVGALLGHPMTIFNGGIVGIVVSAVICVIAALNFILDFDFIERGNERLPKYFEWYGGFALLVTVVWLYLEILRLLAQLNSRR